MTYIDAIIEEVEFNSVEQTKEETTCEKCVHEELCTIDGNPRDCKHFMDKDDFEKRSQAMWKINCDGYYPYCSNCKTEPKNGVMSKYCPECGAEMKQEKEST